MLKGHSVDISETGIAAILTIEALLGEFMELGFMLQGSSVTIRAMIRQKESVSLWLRVL
jgi:hypothetical protein